MNDDVDQDDNDELDEKPGEGKIHVVPPTPPSDQDSSITSSNIEGQPVTMFGYGADEDALLEWWTAVSCAYLRRWNDLELIWNTSGQIRNTREYYGLEGEYWGESIEIYNHFTSGKGLSIADYDLSLLQDHHLQWLIDTPYATVLHWSNWDFVWWTREWESRLWGENSGLLRANHAPSVLRLMMIGWVDAGLVCEFILYFLHLFFSPHLIHLIHCITLSASVYAWRGKQRLTSIIIQWQNPSHLSGFLCIEKISLWGVMSTWGKTEEKCWLQQNLGAFISRRLSFSSSVHVHFFLESYGLNGVRHNRFSIVKSYSIVFFFVLFHRNICYRSSNHFPSSDSLRFISPPFFISVRDRDWKLQFNASSFLWECG